MKNNAPTPQAQKETSNDSISLEISLRRYHQTLSRVQESSKKLRDLRKKLKDRGATVIKLLNPNSLDHATVTDDNGMQHLVQLKYSLKVHCSSGAGDGEGEDHI
jgi:hypothetical protein